MAVKDSDFLKPRPIEPIKTNLSNKVVSVNPPEMKVPGKGFEKMIVGISNGLAKTEMAIFNVAYGTGDPLGGVTFPGNNYKTNGLLPILREINKIDLCHVINYALGNISLLDGKIGEKIKKVHDTAKKIYDFLDLTFLSPTDAKNAETIALIINELIEFDDSLDNEIITVFPKLQDFKTSLSSLTTLLIQYQAAAKTYGVLNDAVNKELEKNPNGSKIDNTSSDKKVVIVVKSNDSKGNVVSTDLEVSIEDLNRLGKTISNRERIVFQQVDLSQIPIKEVQKLMTLVRDVKSILQVIISISSVNDIAGLLIPKEIEELQKIVNPAKLLPVLRSILNYTRGLNQVAQQILGYASVARTIVKVLQFIIKVYEVIVLIYKFLMYPLMYATFSISDAFSSAKAAASAEVDNARKRVTQIGNLIEVIYGFANSIASIIEDVVTQIEILIYNLETCAPSPIISEMKDVKARLQDSLLAVQGLSKNYEDAKKASNQTTYNGYIFKIEEEEVEENTITAKRRRAVAYDYSQIMVTATDLTFATDKTLLFEELRLKLINEGLVQDTGQSLNNDIDVLIAFRPPNIADGTFKLPETTEEIYASIGININNETSPEDVLKKEVGKVQKQINNVISNIKGGDDLKNLTQTDVTDSTRKLKEGIKTGDVNLLSNPQTTTIVNNNANAATQLSQSGGNPDILSDTEVKRLENLIITIDNSPNARGLVNTKQYTAAKEKLKKNAAARLAAGM